MATKKHTRPLIGKSRTERYNISLPPEIANALRKAGKGNLSAGIREAATALRSKA
jgi:hypothetical protein